MKENCITYYMLKKIINLKKIQKKLKQRKKINTKTSNLKNKI